MHLQSNSASQLPQPQPGNDQPAVGLDQTGDSSTIDHGWARTGAQSSSRAQSSQRQQTVRNRRFTYLHQTLLASDYFTPQAMHLRNPMLFKSMFPELDGPPRPAGAGSAAEFPSNGVIASLFDAMDHERAVEVEKEAEGRAGEVETDSDSDEEEPESGYEAQASEAQSGEQAPPVSANDGHETAGGGEDHDAACRMAELIRTMAERWLDGYDADFFDYSTVVDNNSDYDNVDQVNQDAQETWFDQVDAEDSNSNVHCTDTGELDY
ncbi:coiled-coil domain-containing protein-domain-containing protein [Catenaria anguillulae PL171]|uniref:Coiled-coil domain-containing protein-domain-containing protein n=1 Tax=Catenaria anguillulae PL171 TaxID=765915 RepID=A0A1Y2HUH1_9FUNG|nr:coiled-coil domain-containing protein-domain-containing protein [Catenaria anguillulae PL171]